HPARAVRHDFFDNIVGGVAFRTQANPDGHEARIAKGARGRARTKGVNGRSLPQGTAVRGVNKEFHPMVAKKSQQRLGFKTGEYVVYPSHGVGVIVGIEEQEVAGLSLELFVISFEQDKLTLRVPVAKIKSVGMRKLAEEAEVGKALETVTGRARVKRTMWSRRAQEYEAKINSGDLV